MEDVLIVGAGTAGLSAAIYAERAGLSCRVFEAASPGGQIVFSPEVENYPALPKVSGADYAMALLSQAEGCGAKIEYSKVISAELSGKTKKVVTESSEFEGKAIIIANGAARRRLGCRGEEELIGRGVSYCATCDGAFFRGKIAAVVGGGNTAFEDAEYLAGLCEKVYLIHRRDSFRAEKVLQESVLKNKKITVLKNSEISEIIGKDSVSAIKIKNRGTGSETEVPVSAVFVAVGIAPENGMFSSVLKLDEAGYITAGEDCKTAAAGVFAAGDTRTKTLRQLVTAASDGAVAATAAFGYIKTMG